MAFRYRTNAKRVFTSMITDIVKVQQNTQKFFFKNASKYSLQAKGIVLSVVYGAYSPQIYIRTFDLMGSIKSQVIEQGFGIEIYQDAKMTKLKKSGKHEGYAHYFIEPLGSFLAQTRMPSALVGSLPRDFASAWHSHFSTVIYRDYIREVVNA